MFVTLVYVASVALSSLHSFASASPLVARAAQGSWIPPVTAPKEGDVWVVGSTRLVTWDTNGIPSSAANSTGTLLLGYFDGYTASENLNTDRPLASGFPLNKGYMRVQVPDVEPRHSYIVVLMGNSGNASPEFTIENTHRTSAMAHGTSGSPDKVITGKGSNNLKAKKGPTNPPKMSLSPPPAQFPDPKKDPAEPDSSSQDTPPPASCKEHLPSSKGGSTPGSARDTASDDGVDKRC